MNVTELIERLRAIYEDTDTVECADAAEAIEQLTLEVEHLRSAIDRDWSPKLYERRERIAAAERERDEAVALLQKARIGVKNSAVQFGYPYTEYVDSIDAFLAKIKEGGE